MADFPTALLAVRIDMGATSDLGPVGQVDGNLGQKIGIPFPHP